MKQKINLRLGLIALIAILATTAALTFVYYNIFVGRVRMDLATNARMLSGTGIFQTAYEKAGGNPDAIDLSPMAAMHVDGLRITWVDHDGRVLYDNDTNADALGNHLDRPEITAALAQGTGESTRTSSTQNMSTFYYALLLPDSTVLRVSTEARSIISVMLSALPVMVVILAVIMGLCIVIGHLLTVQLIRPINKMAEHLDHIDPMEYRELEPFADKIRSQHDKLLSSVKSRQDFTANISHELKTPLTAISGYAELIEAGMVPPDQSGRIAGQIHQNADRLLSLINDIIRLSELDHQ
ncbi:MAG: histidine kinase dimerization/phospho-acceptor domain-containing protein [Clostridia bacterium]|nr:histidine kinase dimerization/phospho-acceptor domain-containing protein [Clostridia bacterium]